MRSPLFVFLNRLFSRPRLKYDERSSFLCLDSCLSVSGKRKEQIMGYVLEGLFFFMGLLLCGSLLGWPVTIFFFIIGILVTAAGRK